MKQIAIMDLIRAKNAEGKMLTRPMMQLSHVIIDRCQVQGLVNTVQFLAFLLMRSVVIH